MGTYFVNPSVSKGTYGTFQYDKVIGNTGNLVWCYGCKNCIRFDEEIEIEEIYTRNYSERDILVVPVANNIDRGETAFSKRLRKLTATKAKVVLVGLGIQADNQFELDGFVRDIPDSKKRLFRLLSEKCVTIGVRGELAKKCLNELGIHNVRVIGCPSFYSNMTKGGKESLIKLPLGFSQENDGVIINNTGIKDENLGIERVIELYKEKEKIYQIRQSEGDGLDSYRINSKVFFDYYEWNNFLKRDYCLSIGTRLHGNMMSFLNQIPSIWVTHDYRLSDICEILMLPHLSMKDYINVNIEKIYRCLEQYNTDFYNNRNKMLEEYKGFLEENGIEHLF